jgi:hypothetical protein
LPSTLHREKPTSLWYYGISNSRVSKGGQRWNIYTAACTERVPQGARLIETGVTNAARTVARGRMSGKGERESARARERERKRKRKKERKKERERESERKSERKSERERERLY